LTRVSISGRDNIPRDGAYIVTPNHISIFEPPLIASFWPRELEIAAAVEVLEKPFQSQIMRLYGTIHVHRGRLDRSLIRALLGRLADGLPVLIFPEGTRTHHPGLVEGNTGAVYLAAKAGVSIIPVGITGTNRLWELIKRGQRPKIPISIGPAIPVPNLDKGTDRKTSLQMHTRELMKAIANLLPEDYRGLYA
jgi:1-acyl-sn-glycerol-3-phosphate acyltransferase